MSKNLRRDPIQEANAVLTEATIQRWKQWRTWIEANQELLRLRNQVDGERPTFDGDTPDTATTKKRLEEEIHHIPSAVREIFDRAFTWQREAILTSIRAEKRKQGDKSPDPDPETLDLQAYDALHIRCMGDPSNDNLGMVPMTLDADGTPDWNYFDTRLLREVPPEETFALGAKGTDGASRRQTVFGFAAFVIGMAFIVYFFFLPTNTTAQIAVQTTAPDLRIGDAPVTPWTPVALTVAADAAAPIVLTRAAYASWPQPGAGAWREGTAWPLEICLARETLPAADTQVTIQSAGAVPLRVYRVTRERSNPTDLILSDCGGDARLTRYGALVQSPVMPSAAAQEAQTLAGQSFTLDAISVIGPGENPELPDTSAEVHVRVRGNAANWEALQPKLTLLNGTTHNHTGAIATDADGVTLIRYAIAFSTQPLAVAWDLTDPGTGTTVRWRATLPAPLSRDAYFRQALTVEIAAVRYSGSGNVQIDLAVTNSAPNQIVLRAQDIQIAQGQITTNPVTFSAAAGALPAGEEGMIGIDVQIDPRLPFTLTLAGAVFELSIPTEGR
jgi:hypothetical protein